VNSARRARFRRGNAAQVASLGGRLAVRRARPRRAETRTALASAAPGDQDQNEKKDGDFMPTRHPAIPSLDADARRRVGGPTVLASEVERWRTLVGEVGAGVAAPLTSALERIVALTTSGRIDRLGLRALREEVERARQIGIDSQQLARLAGGRLQQSQETVDLAPMLADLLAHRKREAQARGLQVGLPAARPVEVVTDPALLFSLLETLVSWALDCADSTIEFAAEREPWRNQARVTCRFTHPALDLADEVPVHDSVHWRLLEHTAQALGVSIERQIDAHATLLALAFDHPTKDGVDGMSAFELDDGFAPSLNSKPLAGSHILVLAQRRELRAEVRDALRNMGLIIDFVNSVEEAAAFCREGLPHAVVVESLLCGDQFDALRNDIVAEVPEFAFIEVIEDSRAFEMSGFTPASMARVGRDALGPALPSVLLFELSRDG
jgi:hypothetical protein